MAGRRTMLTPEAQARALEAIREGAPYTLAAKAAGVEVSTFYGWLTKGRAGDEPYASFLDAVEDAEAAVGIEALKHIREAGSKDWKAALSLLARRFGFVERQELKVDADVKASRKHDLRKLSVADKERYLEILTKLESDDDGHPTAQIEVEEVGGDE